MQGLNDDPFVVADDVDDRRANADCRLGVRSWYLSAVCGLPEAILMAPDSRFSPTCRTVLSVS